MRFAVGLLIAILTSHWWAPFAVWKGGLGIYGGVLFGVGIGVWVANGRAEIVIDFYHP